MFQFVHIPTNTCCSLSFLFSCFVLIKYNIMPLLLLSTYLYRYTSCLFLVDIIEFNVFYTLSICLLMGEFRPFTFNVLLICQGLCLLFYFLFSVFSLFHFSIFPYLNISYLLLCFQYISLISYFSDCSRFYIIYTYLVTVLLYWYT